MQIVELVLYGYNGQRRVLPFNLGSVNVISGKSKTGKSAVGDIIEYCLGGQSCNIADGIVRNNVAWYGLLLQFDSERVFVARKNPDPGKQSTVFCYYEIGKEICSPLTANFSPNTNNDGIERLLSQKIGIMENIHNPEAEQSRAPLEANIRHALIYCFQMQEEIANPSFLFHRQGEDFMTMAIKDTLPYFLGAVDEEIVSLITERREKARESRILKRKVYELDQLSSNGSEKGISLLAEAVAVGLTDSIDSTEDFNSLHKRLSAIRMIKEIPNEDTEDLLSSLQTKLIKKKDALRTVQETINEMEGYLTDVTGYNTEAGFQKQRLESIGLFENLVFEENRCPLCGGILSEPLPSIEMMKKSILALDSEINNVTRDMPRIRRTIDKYKGTASQLQMEVRNLEAEIEGVYSQMNDADSIRDLNERRARVIGRISYWLENISQIDSVSPLNRRIEVLEKRIADIDKTLSSNSISDRVRSAMSVIQTYMTEWATNLELENAGSPFRLDFGKLTTVVDKDRPVPLREMGSGSNWLGVHLITMLALHKYFIQNNRPVPRFLFIDQPSQVYFPEGFNDDEDQDIMEVRRIYNFLHERVEELQSQMQIIVVDHAKLNNDYFREDTIEEWRDGTHFLVPLEWYSK